jgi:hypothetical protein
VCERGGIFNFPFSDCQFEAQKQCFILTERKTFHSYALFMQLNHRNEREIEIEFRLNAMRNNLIHAHALIFPFPLRFSLLFFAAAAALSLYACLCVENAPALAANFSP